MHALIIRWSESILGTPTLFLLYLGVSPFMRKDADKEKASPIGDGNAAKHLSEDEG